jgi:hypothetical protein
MKHGYVDKKNSLNHDFQDLLTLFPRPSPMNEKGVFWRYLPTLLSIKSSPVFLEPVLSFVEWKRI